MLQSQIETQRLLNQELTRIRIRNPSYSIRAFSRRLGVHSAALSEILKGKRRISKRLAARFAEKLMLAPVERDSFLGLFSKKIESGLRGRSEPIRYLELQADEFQMIAEWYHFGILSLAETDGFRSDAAWIARRLGITLHQARGAIQRLIRIGMLQKGLDGEVRPSGKQYSTSDGIRSLSLQKMHARDLDLARHSLEVDPLEVRDFSAVTMAIDPDEMLQARKMLRSARDRICAKLESGRKKEVYKLCMYLMPLSRGGDEKQQQKKKKEITRRKK